MRRLKDKRKRDGILLQRSGLGKLDGLGGGWGVTILGLVFFVSVLVLLGLGAAGLAQQLRG